MNRPDVARDASQLPTGRRVVPAAATATPQRPRRAGRRRVELADASDERQAELALYDALMRANRSACG